MRPRATRRPHNQKMTRTLRSLETPTCGTESAPGVIDGQMWEGPSGPGLGQGLLPIPSRWLRAVCASAVGPSLSANVWVGVPGTPAPLLSVCGVQEPTPASCQGPLQWSRSSQIVFLGWWPPAPTFSRVFAEIPATSRDLTGAFCPGSCSSVRNKVPNKHISALLTLPLGVSFLTQALGFWRTAPLRPMGSSASSSLHIQPTGKPL